MNWDVKKEKPDLERERRENSWLDLETLEEEEERGIGQVRKEALAEALMAVGVAEIPNGMVRIARRLSLSLSLSLHSLERMGIPDSSTLCLSLIFLFLCIVFGVLLSSSKNKHMRLCEQNYKVVISYIFLEPFFLK